MVTGRQLFRALVYDTDWHSRLRCSLQLAREQVISPETREAICHLEKLLSERDECVHQVSVRAQVPPSLDSGHAYEQLVRILNADNGALRQIESGLLELTVTLRGSRFTAEAEASEMLQRALKQIEAQSNSTLKPRVGSKY